MLEDPFDLVSTGYDRIGERYRNWSSASEVRRRYVGRLLAGLPAGSVVVDLGCGAGEPATRMLAERHHVIGVDGSREQLALARHAAPTALLVHADMTRFFLRPGHADAVASFYALGHVPSDRHAPLFRSISAWLRPGGLLLTSAPSEAGDSTDADWLGVPMFFGGIGEAATRQAIADAGLDLETMDRVEEDEGNGHIVSFLWLSARKPAA